MWLLAGHSLRNRQRIRRAQSNRQQRLFPRKRSQPASRDSLFIAYGDTRSQVDGRALQPDHGALIDSMLQADRGPFDNPLPGEVRLALGRRRVQGHRKRSMGCQLLTSRRETDRAAWACGTSMSAGNHDAPALPASRAIGLRNTIAAVSKLIPAEGSPRRLNGVLHIHSRLRKCFRHGD